MAQVAIGKAVMGALLLVGAVSGAGGCRRGAETRPAPAAGRYVVLDDSSSVHFLFVRDGKAEVGRLGPVEGSVAFDEQFRGLLMGKGSLSVDLTSSALEDSAAAAALGRDVFQVQASRENRAAGVAVRQLFGKQFTAGLPAGGVAPITARAQLVVHGMAISRSFEGEISRTPSGYRITTAVPILLSIRQLGLDDEVAAWTAATGGGQIADTVALTLDLRLARRAPS